MAAGRETGMTGWFRVALLAPALLAACGGGEDPQLMRLRSEGRSPDEFAILPTKPLEIPTGPVSVASLPAPTPGGTNRTDPTPQADAVVALGGRPGAGAAGDAALLAQAGRHGTDPAIRQTLAAADLDYRRRNDGRLLERMFGKTTYFSAYAPYALDQQTELARWRQAGARTPSAPPPEE